jgi:hypothetical protein
MANKLIAMAGNPNILLFMCPGCECGHQIHVKPEKNTHTGAGWGWNGSMEKPTFTPSILVSSGHYSEGRAPGPCWCTFNAERPNEPSDFTCSRCHSYVTDGNIQFLSDSTHKLAGQTIPLPDWA